MKRISMTEFRAQPGEFLLDIIRDGKSYMLTKAGKDVARLLPASEDIVIGPDGERIAGPALASAPPAIPPEESPGESHGSCDCTICLHWRNLGMPERPHDRGDGTGRTPGETEPE